MTTAPRIATGQVVALRLFDLAYSIDLPRAAALWGAAARPRQLSATPAKAMDFGVPPLALPLGPVEMPGLEASAEATARLYDFGIVAITLSLPVQDRDFPGFATLVNRVSRATLPWPQLLAALSGPLAGALDRPATRPLEEDYLFAVVHRLDQPLAAEALLASVDLVPLLSGETRPLSEAARADLMRARFSWYADDLVVLGWDRAFILEPRQDQDVLDVLEMANAQLLELRSYDELLDAELPRVLATVSAKRQGLNLLSARRYARLARRVHALVAEVTEISERVDNALQVTEDVYLARVYAAAINLFRVPSVNAAVDRKLATLRATYAALFEEASASRAELLEIAILVLIALEIVLSLLRH